MAIDLTSLPNLSHLRSLSLKVKEEQAAILQTCTAALTEMNSVKMNKPIIGDEVVGTSTGSSGSTNVWVNDNAVDFPYYYDIPVTGLTSSHYIEMEIPTASLKTAYDCGLSPSVESMTGAIRLRAAEVPNASITVQVKIYSL